MSLEAFCQALGQMHLAGGNTATWVWLGDFNNLLLSSEVLSCATLCKLSLLAGWPGLNHKLQQQGRLTQLLRPTGSHCRGCMMQI